MLVAEDGDEGRGDDEKNGDESDEEGDDEVLLRERVRVLCVGVLGS